MFCMVTTTHALVVTRKWEKSGKGSVQRKEGDEDFEHEINNKLWLGSGVKEFMDGGNRYFSREKNLMCCVFGK